MTQTADVESTGDGRDLVPFLSEENAHAQDGLSLSTEAASDTNSTIVNDALKSLPVPRHSQHPKRPPALDASLSDLLMEEKEIEEKPCLNLEANPHLLEVELRKTNPELVRVRIEHLHNQTGELQQPQYRDLSGRWFLKMEAFAEKRGESWLTEVLSKETDIEFLHQLLDAIHSLDTERVAMSPPVINFEGIVDPLAASPSVLRRERTVELFPPVEELWRCLMCHLE